ncbi:MAG: MazG nucleotide pyrophosphohydrolase domain-containing protein [Patescibacteria group bacterium]
MTARMHKYPKKSQATGKTKNTIYKTPFGKYFRLLDDIDKGTRYKEEFGSILILGLVEEIGEMARAYLAEHGRKKSNLAAQRDETYEQELGDIIVSIIRFARIKKINLDERIMYTIDKISRRKLQPKE